MINAAVVGLGTWGRTMVESLASGSDLMRFTTLQTRTVKPDDEAFAKQHSLKIAKTYEEVLADPDYCTQVAYDAHLVQALLPERYRTRQAA